MGGRSWSWHRIEKLFVVMVALHSYAIFLVLVFFTEWSVRFGGWEEVHPLFFARQGGIFHAVVATGYLLEYVRHRGVALLVVAKLSAVAFLLATMLAGPQPWVVPLAALGDGFLGGLAVVLHRLAKNLD